jgi:NADPH:quinone reductase-like Zn-dependent oxidoreductase
LSEARSLAVSDTVAIDEDDAIAALAPVDAVADTVGGETAAKLFARVKNGGTFGYTSVLPDGVAKSNATVTVAQVWARADAAKVREFAVDFRDGLFKLPIRRRLPLRDASAAHALAQSGGSGKIVLVCRDI